MATPDLETVLNLEREVWEAFLRGDAATDEKLLHESFLGVYSSGFSNRAQHVDQLRGGPVVSDFKLHDARLLILQPDLVLLTYRAEFRRLKSAAELPAEQLYISSLWRQLQGGWFNLFSQDTRVA